VDVDEAPLATASGLWKMERSSPPTQVFIRPLMASSKTHRSPWRLRSVSLVAAGFVITPFAPPPPPHWRVLRAQPRRPRASGQVRRHDRQGNGGGARVAAQRGHINSIPEAPHTPAAGWPQQGHGAAFTKTKSRACPTWTPAPSTHARFATCGRRTHDGEQRKQSTAACSWDAGSGRLGRGPQALWRRAPAPAAWAVGERRGRPNASVSLVGSAVAIHR
jgi:hypothetical protein